MNKGIQVELTTAKTLRLIIAVLLLLAVGHLDNANAQPLTPFWIFSGYPLDGSGPSGLVQGNDGNLYGTTEEGGTVQACLGGCGTVFRISLDRRETILHTFVGTDGASPRAGLVQGSDGDFYGTTSAGGTSGAGTVFKMSPAGTLTALYSFSGGADGSTPFAGLVQGNDSNFYGTTYVGGTSTNCPGGCGTVFEINPEGTLTTLVSFSGVDGANPMESLVQGSDGDFYGTTVYGGIRGDGTVFKISPAGTLTTLYNFSGRTDGYNPRAGLVQGTDGDFYGTTTQGGLNRYNGYLGDGFGTVFKISPSGRLTTLVIFTGNFSATFPEAGLVQGSDGKFYGTTVWGGSSTNCGSGGCGTVFRISSGGELTTLYSFTGRGDGNFPAAVLMEASDRNFYGTTSGGEYMGGYCHGDCGTMFKLSTGLECEYRLRPKRINVQAAGGPSIVKVVTNHRDCDWNAASNDPFITITASTNGVGEGTISYTVASNADTVARIGTMTIASETFTVDQAAATCEFSFAEPVASFSAAGGSSTLVVTANGTNCAWKANVSGSFIKITSSRSGAGDGMVDYTVAANMKPASRKGAITIGKEKLTILQSGAP